MHSHTVLNEYKTKNRRVLKVAGLDINCSFKLIAAALCSAHIPVPGRAVIEAAAFFPVYVRLAVMDTAAIAADAVVQPMSVYDFFFVLHADALTSASVFPGEFNVGFYDIGNAVFRKSAGGFVLSAFFRFCHKSAYRHPKNAAYSDP